MDHFERSFEDMDVRSEYVEQTMNSSTTAAMPEEQVDELMQMVADEHGLKMSDVFKSAVGSTPGAAATAGEAKASPACASAGSEGGGGSGPSSVEDDLEERLRRLRS
jgi:division protein CdvB (Snf7/Vps24/ESCRT-III family)